MYSGNSYKNFPDLYDLLYQRYLKSIPDFVSLVKKNTPRGGTILDLAAGTGEVSIPLLKHGFKVTSLDASSGMLKVLKAKAKKLNINNYNVKISPIENINYYEKFDSICIRQAINYLVKVQGLENGLKKIYRALKPGGKLIFNAPNYRGETAYPIISNYYEKGEQKAFVLEMNNVSNNLLTHDQYSIVWQNSRNKPQFIIDQNSFYMFTKKEFELALKKSGFSKTIFSGNNKTLYCVSSK